MRPPDRNKFREGSPAKAAYQAPKLTVVKLSDDELSAIADADDPQAALRDFHYRLKARTVAAD